MIAELQSPRYRDWQTLELSPRTYKRMAVRYRRRRTLRAIAFVFPFAVFWLAFLALPACWIIGLSLFSGGVVDDAQFVGFDNWSAAIDNPELRRSIGTTFYFLLMATAGSFFLGVGLALLLNTYRRGGTFFKLAYYIPLLAPAVVVGLIWQFMTHYDFGVANSVVTAFGGDRLNILGDARLALLAIVSAEVWRSLGFWVLFFLAGFQSVPDELLEAARVDGADRRRRFFRITVPLLRPLLLFAVVIAIIFNLQVFDSVYTLTDGGPAGATTTIVWFIYRELFVYQNSGLAYAMSVGLLVLILSMTLVALRLLRDRRGSAS